MDKTAWVVVEEGTKRGRLVADDGISVKITTEDGQEHELFHKQPNGPFYPAFYIQEEQPELWFFEGRSLRVRRPEEFEDPEAAMAMVPRKVPFKFLPHTRQVVDGIINQDPQILVGPHGTGKTSLVEQIAARINQPSARVNINPMMMMSDLVGQVGIVGGETVWLDSYIPQTMRAGWWLILDEFPFVDPAISSHFFPFLEKPPVLTLKEKPGGEVLRPAKSWRVFATGNALGEDDEYTGQQQMNAALKSRFAAGQIIEVERMSYRQELDVVRKRLPWAPGNIVKRAVRVANKIRQEGIYKNLSPREVLNWIEKIVLNKDYVAAAKITWMPLVAKEDREKAERLVEKCGRVILGRTISETEKKKVHVPPNSPRMPLSSIPRDRLPERLDMGGRRASEVVEADLVRAVHDAYEKAGLSFSAIEEYFNLKGSSGNTARRIWLKYKESSQVA